MASKTPQLDGFLAINLIATQQIAALALDGAAWLLKNQGELLQRARKVSDDEMRHFWSGDSEESLKYFPRMMEHHLDFAAEATRSCFDLATQYQDGLSQVRKELMPRVAKHLLAAR